MTAWFQKRRIANSVGLVLVLVVSSIPAAHAQMRRCAYHTLTDQDHARLTEVIRSALPPSVRINGDLSVCRNPQGASAWLETRHRKAADDGTEWWELDCGREKRDWSCKPAEHKRKAELKVTISSAIRTLTLYFDGSMSIGDARDLTLRAYDLLEHEDAPLSACGDDTPGRSDPKRWRDEQSRNRLDSSQTTLSMAVERDGESYTVYFSADRSGFAITFQPRKAGADQFMPLCWGEWIVVT